MAPPREHDEAPPRKQGISREFIAAVLTVTLTLGIPGLIWGGGINSTVNDHTKQIDSLRTDIREDLHEINRKLDALAEKAAK